MYQPITARSLAKPAATASPAAPSSRLAGGPGGAPATSRGGGKGRAKSAATAPVNRARQMVMRQSLNQKRALEKNILRHQEGLSAPGAASVEAVKDACAILQPLHWDEIALERNLIDYCAYPRCDEPYECSNTVSTVIRVRPASRGPLRVVNDELFDLLALKNDLHGFAEPWKPLAPSEAAILPPDADVAHFCSRRCLLRSKTVRVQLDEEPVYLRLRATPPVQLPEELEHQKRDPVEAYVSDILSTPLDVPREAVASVVIRENEAAAATTPASATASDADPTDQARRVDGYASRDPHVTQKRRPRGTKSAAAAPSLPARALSELPTTFTLVASAFTGVVTPRTRRWLKHGNDAPPKQPPSSEPSSSAAQARSSDASSGDEDEEEEEEEYLPLNLHRKLQTGIFQDRFQTILRSVAELIAPDTDTRHRLLRETRAFSVTLRATSGTNSILETDSMYSWLFVLIVIWGACRPHPDLAAAVIDAKPWHMVVEGILNEVQHDLHGHAAEAKGVELPRPLTVDQIEDLAKFVFM
ncbi:RNA polymerase II associated protein 2 [Blastocladiella emersonii ATCC 22665]|nr:RNA polymerase II associated protein 2 [Blastocladiella emersonii ATCC 22665]